MNTFIAEFNYTGKAPTSSFVRGLIENAGYSSITELSTVRWKIKTKQSESTVQSGLNVEVKNHGKYTNGEITSVDVSAEETSAHHA